MRKVMCISILIAAVMLLLPLSILGETEKTIPVTSFESDEIIAKIEKVDFFRVYNTKSGKVEKISTEDYIFGVVAAEMPALYHEEALKAQAVAAYTYACRKRANSGDRDYDITTDHTVDQSYNDEQTAREKWGSKADEYIEKIRNAVKETEGYVITYNDNLITAVYHAVSAGKTEDCKNVWGSDVAYLKSVNSEGDKLSANYISQANFTPEEIKEKFSDITEFTDDTKKWFSDPVRTKSGTVTEITLCSKTLSGDDIRAALNLRSANFETEFKNGEFIFTVYGYGHGVGMSQNGANFLAEQGFNFKEILTHYYTDCEIKKTD